MDGLKVGERFNRDDVQQVTDGDGKTRYLLANPALEEIPFRINNGGGDYDPRNVSKWLVPSGADVHFVRYAKTEMGGTIYFALYEVQIRESLHQYLGFRLTDTPSDVDVDDDDEVPRLALTALKTRNERARQIDSEQDFYAQAIGRDSKMKHFHLRGIGDE